MTHYLQYYDVCHKNRVTFITRLLKASLYKLTRRSAKRNQLMQKIKTAIFDHNPSVTNALRMRLSMESSLEVLYAGIFRCDVLEGETAVIALLGLTSDSNVNPKQTEQMVTELVSQETAVIVLAPYINDTEHKLALAAGAKRYLLKTINSNELVEEITAVYSDFNTCI